MDVTQVQSSIEAVNRLVALVVSRSVSMVQDVVAAEAELATQGAAKQQAAQMVPPVEPGLGQQVDLLV